LEDDAEEEIEEVEDTEDDEYREEGSRSETSNTFSTSERILPMYWFAGSNVQNVNIYFINQHSS
jgi:hypothetical protein